MEGNDCQDNRRQNNMNPAHHIHGQQSSQCQEQGNNRQNYRRQYDIKPDHHISGQQLDGNMRQVYRRQEDIKPGPQSGSRKEGVSDRHDYRLQNDKNPDHDIGGTQLVSNDKPYYRRYNDRPNSAQHGSGWQLECTNREDYKRQNDTKYCHDSGGRRMEVNDHQVYRRQTDVNSGHRTSGRNLEDNRPDYRRYNDMNPDHHSDNSSGRQQENHGRPEYRMPNDNRRQNDTKPRHHSSGCQQEGNRRPYYRRQHHNTRQEREGNSRKYYTHQNEISAGHHGSGWKLDGESRQNYRQQNDIDFAQHSRHRQVEGDSRQDIIPQNDKRQSDGRHERQSDINSDHHRSGQQVEVNSHHDYRRQNYINPVHQNRNRQLEGHSKLDHRRPNYIVPDPDQLEAYTRPNDRWQVITPNYHKFEGSAKTFCPSTNQNVHRRKMILDGDSRHSRTDSVHMNVPSTYVSTLIGREGSNIKGLEFETNCRIQIHKDTCDGTSTVVELIGHTEAQEHARDLIEKCVQDYGSTEYAVAMKGRRATAQSTRSTKYDGSTPIYTRDTFYDREKYTQRTSSTSDRHKRRTTSYTLYDLNKCRVGVNELESGDYKFRLGLTSSPSGEDKQYFMESKMHIPIICALTNTSGGLIEVLCPGDLIDTWWRNLLEQISKYFKEGSSDLCTVMPTTDKIHIRVHRSKEFITTHTHMFKRDGPRTCQVNNRNEIVSILTPKGNRKHRIGSANNSIEYLKHEDFCKERESETLEFKEFECSSHADLIQRIKQPRTRNTLLAMSNQITGGRVIIGINNQRIAVGQKMLKEDQGLFEDELGKLLSKNEDETFPVWGEKSSEKYWECDIYPLKRLVNARHIPKYPCENGCDDCPHSERRVLICITMLYCPGGVFARKPESFMLDDRGYISEVPFDQWKNMHGTFSKHVLFPELTFNQTVDLFKTESPINYHPSKADISAFLQKPGKQPCMMQHLETTMRNIMKYEGTTLTAFAVTDRALHSCIESDPNKSQENAGNIVHLRKPPTHLLDVLLVTESAEMFLFVICSTFGELKHNVQLNGYTTELARISNKKIIESMVSNDCMDNFKDVRIRCAIISLDGKQRVYDINECFQTPPPNERRQRKLWRISGALATLFTKPMTNLRDEIYRELDRIQLQKYIGEDEHRFNIIEGPPGCDTLHLAQSVCKLHGEDCSLLISSSKLVCEHAERGGVRNVFQAENSDRLVNLLSDDREKWDNVVFLYGYNFSFSEEAFREIYTYTTASKQRHFWLFQESGYTNYRGGADSFQQFYEYLKRNGIGYEATKTMAIAKIHMSSMSVGSYISQNVPGSLGRTSDVKCVSRVDGAGVQVQRITNLSGKGLLEYLEVLLAEPLNSRHRCSHYLQRDIVILIDQEREDEFRRFKDLLANKFSDIKVCSTDEFCIASRMIVFITSPNDPDQLKKRLANVEYRLSVASRAVDRLDILHETEVDVTGLIFGDAQIRSQVCDEQDYYEDIQETPHTSKSSSCSTTKCTPEMTNHQEQNRAGDMDADQLCCNCSTISRSRFNVIESPPGCDKHVTAQNACLKFGKKCSAYISSSQQLVNRLIHSGEVDAFYAKDSVAIIPLLHNISKLKCCFVINDCSNFEYSEQVCHEICSFIADKNHRCLFVIEESYFQNYQPTEAASFGDFVIQQRHTYGSCIVKTDHNICTNTQSIASYMINHITRVYSDISVHQWRCQNAEMGDGVFLHLSKNIHRWNERNTIIRRMKQLLYKSDTEVGKYSPGDIAILFGKRKPDIAKDEVNKFRDLFKRFLPDITIQDADTAPVSGVIIDEVDNFSGLESKVIIFVPHISFESVHDEHSCDEIFDIKHRIGVVSRGTHRVEFIITKELDDKTVDRLKQELHPALEIMSDNLQNQLDDIVRNQCQRFNVIECPPGTGKSLLAQQLCEAYGRGNYAYISASNALNNRVKRDGLIGVYHAENVEDIRSLMRDKILYVRCIVIDDYNNFIYSESELHDFCCQITRDGKQLYVLEESALMQYETRDGAVSFKDFLVQNRLKYGSILLTVLNIDQVCSNALESFIETQVSEICSGVVESEIKFPVRGSDGQVVIDRISLHQVDAIIDLVRHELSSENESQNQGYNMSDIAVLVDHEKEHVALQEVAHIKDVFNKYYPESCTQSADVYPVKGVIIDSLENYRGLDARVVIFILVNNKARTHAKYPKSLSNPRYRIAIASKGTDRVYFLLDAEMDVNTLKNINDNTSAACLPTSSEAVRIKKMDRDQPQNQPKCRQYDPDQQQPPHSQRHVLIPRSRGALTQTIHRGLPGNHHNPKNISRKFRAHRQVSVPTAECRQRGEQSLLVGTLTRMSSKRINDNESRTVKAHTELMPMCTRDSGFYESPSPPVPDYAPCERNDVGTVPDITSPGQHLGHDPISRVGTYDSQYHCSKRTKCAEN